MGKVFFAASGLQGIKKPSPVSSVRTSRQFKAGLQADSNKTVAKLATSALRRLKDENFNVDIGQCYASFHYATAGDVLSAP
ncbi:hypothetical protein [Polaromonas vacuolata]|uniref:hypothetical protein n=1 Tax=Polaromonas vacuolata TaxID=37448 RepID=UPI001EE343A1|nr:hypothetical protein [Polaromonas vacuolata]